MNDLVEKCWIFVSVMKLQILIIDHFGTTKAYVVDSVTFKSRDIFMNDVSGAQDVTKLVSNYQLNLALPGRLDVQSQLDNLPKKNFAFGHDNFVWLKSIKENIY